MPTPSRRRSARRRPIPSRCRAKRRAWRPRPEADNLVGIYAALADIDQGRGAASEFGGAQFSAFKAALADLAVAKLAPIAAEMKRLMRTPPISMRCSPTAPTRAQAIAAETMKAVKDIVGFVRR